MKVGDRVTKPNVWKLPQAVGTVKKVSMELGGHAPFVVLMMQTLMKLLQELCKVSLEIRVRPVYVRIEFLCMKKFMMIF